MSENILKNKSLWYGISTGIGAITIIVVFILGAIYGPELRSKFASKKDDDQYGKTQTDNESVTTGVDVSQLAEAVVPSNGVVLPVKWGDLGKQLITKGVIDQKKFLALYNNRIGLSENELKMLNDDNNGNITINSNNAGVILNLLWALGLSNKNPILDSGPMVDKQYGGAENFASTGGWSLSKGDVMNHYSRYTFIKLNNEQQATVERVSQNIFRPCCNNSTYFPDCNHGMAMLGLLEMMASQGISENEMYKIALQVNSYWFPDTYMTLAKYETSQGIDWKNVDPKKMLSATYSSASGYRAVRSKTEPVQQSGGGGCGV